MNNWDKILKDFARKCKGGAPDMINPRHLALLRESLIKFGWKENATNEFIGNLREVACGVGQNPEDTGCEPASGGSDEEDGEEWTPASEKPVTVSSAERKRLKELESNEKLG